MTEKKTMFWLLKGVGVFGEKEKGEQRVRQDKHNSSVIVKRGEDCFDIIQGGRA